MNYNKKQLFMKTSALLITACMVTGCSGKGTDLPQSDTSAAETTKEENDTAQQNETQSTSGTNEEIEGLDTAEMFSDSDQESDYDADAVSEIVLKDQGSQSESAHVSVQGDVVTIKKEGVYLLSGGLKNGQIVVDADKSEKVRLILNGVDINCDASAALYIKSAEKVFVTLADGTQNTFSNQEEFVAVDDNKVDGVIFAKDDLTINGNGNLSVKAAYGHGIVCKDDLVFTGGEYKIVSERQGLSGKQSIRVLDGSFEIESGGDGMHAEDVDDETKGFIYIAGGKFQITCGGDGMDASNILEAAGGAIEVVAGGGCKNTGDNATSTKGLKANGNLLFHDGDYSIDSADDAIHSNSSILLEGGTYSIYTGDDGIHADDTTAIYGGDLTVHESYEGIEGQKILAAGGEIHITSSDDGFNAAGGNDESGMTGGPGGRRDAFAVDQDAELTISGGKLYINAEGDGIDSNGSLFITGGEIYVSGPSRQGNGALDSGAGAQITGGIFVAASAGGMEENFDDTSTQGAMLVSVSGSQTGNIVLKDKDGNEIVSYTPEKAYNAVVVSTPEVIKGETYELAAGDETVSVEMTEMIYGSGSGMRGGHGGGMKGHGDRDGMKGHGGMRPDMDQINNNEQSSSL